MPNEFGRPIHLDSMEQLLQLIERGSTDSILPQIREAVEQREQTRKEEARKLVREVFGNNAQIVEGQEGSA